MRPNVLLITADDMNYDSPGFAGCPIPEITPNLDRLAGQGMWFKQAHVTVAICQPSRQAIMTGRYPHNSKAPGFNPIDRSVPTLQEQLHKAGYLNAILGKTAHLQPMEKFRWDYVVSEEMLGLGRIPELYHRYAGDYFAQARSLGRPFFMMANSHDPHRPFAGSEQEKEHQKLRHSPYPPASRYYRPEEVTVPGFLPDIPEVRREVAQYYSSVHRCDETAGAILRALDASGMADNTLVMFLSDNGMSFPYSKTNCYLNSTKTPWIARWPGQIKPGKVDSEHFVSGIDYMATIIEAAGLEAVSGMDGKSFLPLLTGGEQTGREKVFTVFEETVAKIQYPMRCVQDAKYGYIYNAWSDGKTVFKNEASGSPTFRAMQASTDPKIAERVKFFQYRAAEELYDIESDPSALKNLANDPKHKTTLEQMRKELVENMTSTKDHILDAYKTYLSTGKQTWQPEVRTRFPGGRKGKAEE